ncbi:chemotaxis protein CheW [Paraliomyxa miuraensis]|uniref:chemotaxis protein CheW n=1 Tax=Paraliomyxa miuraensis TaxID=376150 RepID=UPI002256FADA|nr:chemotaxis protein CheW [Paraliomyxa miuraensis]MCX4245789.1 chemotaxis protein CheW [Paraliomyxa miuraensis]
MSTIKTGQQSSLGRRLRGMVGTGADGRSFDDERGDSDHDELKLAGFFVGGALYGIDIMRIKEVIQARPYPVRPVPHAPRIVEGVIQLRGVVIPVIDLRKRFRAAFEEELTRLNKLIIVSVRGRIVGLRVDRIVGELRVPAGALRPAPSMLRGDVEGDEQDFFSGVCRVGNEMVFVVNLETVIDPTRGTRTPVKPPPAQESSP